MQEVLLKPVNASVLFDTMMRVVGQSLDDGTLSASPVPDATLVLLQQVVGARILLVEDNELNQQVATELLQDAGFAVDVAENGLLSLAMVEQASYDIVLMDMQMPVMDGVSATQEIRRRPQHAALPIVAMTANAMQADRDRCLAAGMNGFVSKPIEPEDLWDALARFIRPREGLGVAIAHTVPMEVARPVPQAGDSAAATLDVPDEPLPSGIAGLDVAVGLRRAGGKHSLYLRLLRRFTATQALTVRNIRAALDNHDTELAVRLAHTLKGLAGNIGAVPLQTAAAPLESSIKNTQERTLLEPLLDHAEAVLAPLVQALQQALPDRRSEPQANVPVLDAAKVRAALDSLNDLLACGDGEALDYVNDNSPLLRQGLGPAYDSLCTAVNNFEFDEAQVLIAQTSVLQR
jgi:two-component system sensor histidine kinase/response regulator